MEIKEKILIIVFLWMGFSNADSLYISHLEKEELFFSLTHSSIAKASAIISASSESLDDQPCLNIKAKVKTGRFADLFFHIDNHYSSIVELPAWRLRLLSKVIDQTNIQQRWTTRFYPDKNIAKTGDGKTWTFDPKALDPFALLYYVRFIDPDIGDSLSIAVEVESQTWILTGLVSRDTLENGLFADQPLRRLTFEYNRNNNTPREWKTDLFTNRFAQKQASLMIYLGPRPVSLPVRIVFGHPENNVKMDLTKYKFMD
ncbi:DUF3108 domain-containing protein [candidate division KSB1 bacterium]|nr:DUF3108 domain-containing protein [candidate division KSB1 bacterium]